MTATQVARPDGHSAGLELHVDLPPHWKLIDDATWEHPQPLGSSGSPLVGAAFDLLDAFGKPDLIATLFAALADSDDEIITVLMASLVVQCTPEHDLPGHEILPAEGRIRRAVTITPEVTADLFQLTVIKKELVSGIGAVATFSTPNLPFVSEMISGFRSIADSIRVVRMTV